MFIAIEVAKNRAMWVQVTKHTLTLAIVLQSNYLGQETIILLKERGPRDRVFEKSFSSFTLQKPLNIPKTKTSSIKVFFIYF
jgi:hypothetical protein